MSLATLIEDGSGLAEELQKHGPSSTSCLDAAKDLLSRYGRGNINDLQISRALLFLVLTPDSEQYRPDIFISAVRDFTPTGIDWQAVLRKFDREGLAVSPTQFLSLYKALLPITQDFPDFDIQLLWGGRWSHTSTQLSFALGMASLSPEQLDATSIPKLRKAYDPKDCSDGPDDVVKVIQEAESDPVISIDAVSAICQIMFDHEHSPEPEDTLNARELIGTKTALFLCSAAGVPKPWSPNHHTLMSRLFGSCLQKHTVHYQFALHSLWKQDKDWLLLKLVQTHLEDPIKLPVLLEHANEHGWMDELCTLINGFGIDLAALAHRKGQLDIDQWAEDKLSRGPIEFVTALSKFLYIKAEDELRTVKGEQPAPRTVSLAMKTVHAMLAVVEEYVKDKNAELIRLERKCLQCFPRLINYGEGLDDVIEANGEDSNMFSQATDAEMQDLYKRMYSAELEVRNILEALRECKTSIEPAKQDLFACMIHGLFDEYVCFNEYPLLPLSTTAVLFGGIISFGLISNLTLTVGLDMVLEAVRNYDPETSMYKFGLQALLHFLNRLPEWPEFCQQLVQIPGLQGTDAHVRAQEVLRDERNGTNGVNGMTNGIVNDFNAVVPFRSVHADPLPDPEQFEDPEEDVQDKVLFVLNNVSEQNINAKFTDLVEALEVKHHHWFASYLVEQRAKLQPNYQQLYLDLLGMLGEKSLWSEVLRETYVSVRNLLNAESTAKSSSEQVYLTNLGHWLGSLTIARDKPIKHRNIAFKELLIEGWETERLALVIKFTCAVLSEGVKSVVFKPPNPWVMEIISLLLELYDLPELKINQKFAIEILLRELGQPKNGKKMPRSNELEKRQQQIYEDERAAAVMPGLEGFQDMTIGTLDKGVRNTRFSPSSIEKSLPDLDELLVFPPSSGSPPNQARLRQIVLDAVQRAILEIIGPVVERSVTIATIATRDLIHKDYAQEPDEDRVREASQQMAKALSGSLALVTCKEPLRMSMTNYIRLAVNEIPDQAFPEGSILMCVNDNLDTACSLVEKQAEERSMPEINVHIENEIAKRRQFKAEYPSESYRDPITSHWSSYIPEPYKQVPGGLNQEQLDIYLQFARQTRGVTNHVQNLSTDSGKQIPDVLQDGGFPSMPNLATPAEQPAVPLQPPQMQQQQRGVLPSAMNNARVQPHMNGFVDAETLHQHIQELFAKITQLTTSSPEAHYKDLARDNPILDIVNAVDPIVTATSERDAVAFHIADAACTSLYEASANSLEIEVLAHVVHRLCQISEATALKVILHFRNQDDEKLLNPMVTAALLELGLLEFPHVDMVLAKAIHQRRNAAIDSLSELLNSLLFTKNPVALRADFASSLGAMGEWLSQDPDHESAKAVIADLRKEGVPEVIEGSPEESADVKQAHQMQYIFSEWLALCGHPDRSESMSVAFITQLHHRQILNTPEDMVLFLRLCIEASVDALERFDINPSPDPNEGFFSTDSLSRLVVLMVKNQGESDGAVKGSKPAYMHSILSLIILVLNNHHVMRGEQFNQRMFYRLFSTLLFDWNEYGRGRDTLDDKEMMRVFADNFLLLDPHYLPGFVYGWLSLVSHRVFMPSILRQSDDEVGVESISVSGGTNTDSTQGCEPFAKIMEAMLSYVSDLLRPGTVAAVAKELYRGVLRILLILHHDFPEFLAENHYRICNTIPAHCTQLRNLVLSAYPSSILELPDPFTAGLKVDRLDEIRRAPHIAGDIMAPLNATKIKNTIDEALRGSSISDEQVAKVVNAVNRYVEDDSSSHLDTSLPNAVVLYIGHTAISSDGIKSGPSFDPKSPQATLMSKMAKEFHPEARYYFLSAIVNQLRYPNSHTHFFSYALLHLFGSDLADQEESDVRQQITRVLLERLIVHRPHPWGLIITLLELLKNPTYMFWDLPFIKANPEVGAFYASFPDHLSCHVY
jgi:CCR4-NOT transcription complex subunit 1